MAAALDDILDPGYLGDLEARPMDEIRAMRGECQEIETGLSLLRRMVQGRLDIVGTELQRRADGGDPADLPDLISRLPTILSDRTRTPGVGRLSQALEPAEMPEELEAELDAIVSPGSMTHLPTLDDAVLRDVVAKLEAFEHVVSGHRRALFERIDALQAEITRRYRTGEASIDTLLA